MWPNIKTRGFDSKELFKDSGNSEMLLPGRPSVSSPGSS